MLGLAGVTAMDTSVAAPPPLPLLLPPQVFRDAARDPRNNIARTNLIIFMRTPRFTSTRGHCTVRVVLRKILPDVAVIVAVPAATAVARPLLITVATDMFDELQMTCVVISKLVPSEYAPEAENCWVNPTCIPDLSGVTSMEDRIAEVTVKGVLPEIVPEAVVVVAVMVAASPATAVATPPLLIITTDVFDELQVTCAVIS